MEQLFHSIAFVGHKAAALVAAASDLRQKFATGKIPLKKRTTMMMTTRPILTTTPQSTLFPGEATLLKAVVHPDMEVGLQEKGVVHTDVAVGCLQETVVHQELQGTVVHRELQETVVHRDRELHETEVHRDREIEIFKGGMDPMPVTHTKVRTTSHWSLKNEATKQPRLHWNTKYRMGRT
jgi:hypothetical protein